MRHERQEHKTNIKKGKRGFQPGQPRPDRKSERWQENTPESFYNWIEDIQPRVLTRSGRYEVFQPTEEQTKTIKAVFETDRNGFLKHSMILDIEPRRHGKSTVYALIVLFFFTARRNFVTALLGNTDQHCHRVQFRLLENIIKNTPELKVRINPIKCIYNDHIRQEVWGNWIIKTGVSMSTAFGDRINLLWVSDLHASPDIGPFNALQASLLDSENSLILIDSNVDEIGGPVHELQKEAGSDSSIYANHIFYRDFDHFCKKAPEWIDRKKAKRMMKTVLPVEFDRDILGKRNSAVNGLFPPQIIKRCKTPYQIPVTDIEGITQGRAYKIGGGLDRAKKLLAGRDGDHTVWTVVCKVANPEGEPEYYILNQVRFTINTSKAIKAQILEDHKRYKLNNVCLENYEVTDLLAWMGEQGIPCELISATDTNQNASFPEFHRICKEGRFHFPNKAKLLPEEMSTFVYTQRKTAGTYSFGHSSSKFHDDAVYSTNWAIFALRHEVLDLYRLSSIICSNMNPVKRSLCFLMGGDKTLFCSEQCRAYQEVKEMFRQFKSYQLDSELDIAEFFHAYVKVNGIVQYQGV